MSSASDKALADIRNDIINMSLSQLIRIINKLQYIVKGEIVTMSDFKPKAGGKAEELSADVVLVAIGRRPYTQGLGLEGVGVAMERGFVKIDAATALRAAESGGMYAMKSGLVRAGIELIVEKIESEAMLLDLLDHDVDYGQGYLFGPPRAARQAA